MSAVLFSSTDWPGTQALGAVIIRTQGTRNELLEEALLSVANQSEPCLAIVVVHNAVDVAELVRQHCAEIDGLHAVFLTANDRSKGRSYPLNLALDWAYAQSTKFRFLSFLDDDDRLYPGFGREMRCALQARACEIVYCSSNRITNGKVEAGYGPMPFPSLFRENFIPINALAFDFEALSREKPFFDESIEYAEDWRFLLGCLARGFRIEYHPRVLCEFLVATDGNLPNKRDPEKWKACSLAIRRFINQSAFPVSGSQLASLAVSIDPNIPARDDMIFHLERALQFHRDEINRLARELQK